MRISQYITVAAALLLAACGDSGTDTTTSAAAAPPVDAPAVTFTPSGEAAGKPSGPITVAYRIIGQPVVGQPIAIELALHSALGAQPISVDYRITDASALRLGDSQPPFLSIAPTVGESIPTHQVTIVPLREGRLYLNVSASVLTENGSVSTVTAIPIQVGEGGRRIEQNGTITTDENGEAIHSLPAGN